MSSWAVVTSEGLFKISSSVLKSFVRGDGQLFRGRFIISWENLLEEVSSFEDGCKKLKSKLNPSGDGTLWETAIKLPGSLILIEVNKVQGIRPEIDTLMDLLDALGEYSKNLGVSKVDSDEPQTALGMKKATLKLLREWQQTLSGSAAESIDEFIKVLESEDWSKKTEEEIKTEFEEVSKFIPPTVLKVLPKVVVQGMNASLSLALKTREGIITAEGMNVDLSFNLKDKKAISNLSKMQTKQMPTTFMKASASTSALLQKRLIEGMDSGLNYKAVVRDLIKELPEIVTKKQKNYLEVTASNVLARSRSQGQLMTYKAGGIVVIKASAVLDERTTPFCRFINGQVLLVEPMLDYYNTASENDTDPKEAFPWVNQKLNKTSQETTFSFVDPTGKTQVFAKGAEGNVKYTEGWSGPKIQGYGIFPPYHAKCRTTTYYDSEI